MPHREWKRRILALIDQTGPRLTSRADYLAVRVESIRGIVDAGECGLALEILCSNLYEFDVPLRDDEINEIESLAAVLGLPEHDWAYVRKLRN